MGASSSSAPSTSGDVNVDAELRSLERFFSTMSLSDVVAHASVKKVKSLLPSKASQEEFMKTLEHIHSTPSNVLRFAFEPGVQELAEQMGSSFPISPPIIGLVDGPAADLETFCSFCRDGEFENVQDMLSRYHVNLLWCTEDGYSPFHYAVVSGSSDLVALLLGSMHNLAQSSTHPAQYFRALVDLRTRDDEMLTPLILAVLRRRSRIVEELLLAGADPFKCDSHGRDALSWAEKNQFDEGLQYLRIAVLHVEENSSNLDDFATSMEYSYIRYMKLGQYELALSATMEALAKETESKSIRSYEIDSLYSCQIECFYRLQNYKKVRAIFSSIDKMFSWKESTLCRILESLLRIDCLSDALAFAEKNASAIAAFGQITPASASLNDWLMNRSNLLYGQLSRLLVCITDTSTCFDSSCLCVFREYLWLNRIIHILSRNSHLRSAKSQIAENLSSLLSSFVLCNSTLFASMLSQLDPVSASVLEIHASSLRMEQSSNSFLLSISEIGFVNSLSPVHYFDLGKVLAMRLFKFSSSCMHGSPFSFSPFVSKSMEKNMISDSTCKVQRIYHRAADASFDELSRTVLKKLIDKIFHSQADLNRMILQGAQADDLFRKASEASFSHAFMYDSLLEWESFLSATRRHLCSGNFPIVSVRELLEFSEIKLQGIVSAGVISSPPNREHAMYRGSKKIPFSLGDMDDRREVSVSAFGSLLYASIPLTGDRLKLLTFGSGRSYPFCMFDENIIEGISSNCMLLSVDWAILLVQFRPEICPCVNLIDPCSLEISRSVHFVQAPDRVVRYEAAICSDPMIYFLYKSNDVVRMDSFLLIQDGDSVQLVFDHVEPYTLSFSDAPVSSLRGRVVFPSTSSSFAIVSHIDPFLDNGVLERERYAAIVDSDSVLHPDLVTRKRSSLSSSSLYLPFVTMSLSDNIQLDLRDFVQSKSNVSIFCDQDMVIIMDTKSGIMSYFEVQAVEPLIQRWNDVWKQSDRIQKILSSTLMENRSGLIPLSNALVMDLLYSVFIESVFHSHISSFFVGNQDCVTKDTATDAFFAIEKMLSTLFALLLEVPSVSAYSRSLAGCLCSTLEILSASLPNSLTARLDGNLAFSLFRTSLCLFLDDPIFSTVDLLTLLEPSDVSMLFRSVENVSYVVFAHCDCSLKSSLFQRLVDFSRSDTESGDSFPALRAQFARRMLLGLMSRMLGTSDYIQHLCSSCDSALDLWDLLSSLYEMCPFLPDSPQNEFFASRVLRSTFGAMCMFLEIISSSGVIFHDGASDLFERISSSIENILRSSSTSSSHIRLFRVKLFDCLQKLASEIKQVPSSSSGNSSMFISSQVPSLIRVIVSTCQRHLRLFGVQSSSEGNGRAFIEHSRVFKGVDDSIDSIQAASTDFNHLFKLSDKCRSQLIPLHSSINSYALTLDARECPCQSLTVRLLYGDEIDQARLLCGLDSMSSPNFPSGDVQMEIADSSNSEIVIVDSLGELLHSFNLGDEISPENLQFLIESTSESLIGSESDEQKRHALFIHTTSVGPFALTGLLSLGESNSFGELASLIALASETARSLFHGQEPSPVELDLQKCLTAPYFQTGEIPRVNDCFTYQNEKMRLEHEFILALAGQISTRPDSDIFMSTLHKSITLASPFKKPHELFDAVERCAAAVFLWHSGLAKSALNFASQLLERESPLSSSTSSSSGNLIPLPIKDMWHLSCYKVRKWAIQRRQALIRDDEKEGDSMFAAEMYRVMEILRYILSYRPAYITSWEAIDTVDFNLYTSTPETSSSDHRKNPFAFFTPSLPSESFREEFESGFPSSVPFSRDDSLLSSALDSDEGFAFVQKTQSLGVHRRLERASLRAIAKKVYQRRQGASPSDSSVSREGSSGEESLSVLTKLLDLISMQNASVESITATVVIRSERRRNRLEAIQLFHALLASPAIETYADIILTTLSEAMADDGSNVLRNVEPCTSADRSKLESGLQALVHSSLLFSRHKNEKIMFASMRCLASSLICRSVQRQLFESDLVSTLIARLKSEYEYPLKEGSIALGYCTSRIESLTEYSRRMSLRVQGFLNLDTFCPPAFNLLLGLISRAFATSGKKLTSAFQRSLDQILSFLLDSVRQCVRGYKVVEKEAVFERYTEMASDCCGAILFLLSSEKTSLRTRTFLLDSQIETDLIALLRCSEVSVASTAAKILAKIFIGWDVVDTLEGISSNVGSSLSSSSSSTVSASCKNPEIVDQNRAYHLIVSLLELIENAVVPSEVSDFRLRTSPERFSFSCNPVSQKSQPSSESSLDLPRLVATTSFPLMIRPAIAAVVVELLSSLCSMPLFLSILIGEIECRVVSISHSLHPLISSQPDDFCRSDLMSYSNSFIRDILVLDAIVVGVPNLLRPGVSLHVSDKSSLGSLFSFPFLPTSKLRFVDRHGRLPSVSVADSILVENLVLDEKIVDGIYSHLQVENRVQLLEMALRYSVVAVNTLDSQFSSSVTKDKIVCFSSSHVALLHARCASTRLVNGLMDCIPHSSQDDLIADYLSIAVDRTVLLKSSKVLDLYGGLISSSFRSLLPETCNLFLTLGDSDSDVDTRIMECATNLDEVATRMDSLWLSTMSHSIASAITHLRKSSMDVRRIESLLSFSSVASAAFYSFGEDDLSSLNSSGSAIWKSTNQLEILRSMLGKQPENSGFLRDLVLRVMESFWLMEDDGKDEIPFQRKLFFAVLTQQLSRYIIRSDVVEDDLVYQLVSCICSCSIWYHDDIRHSQPICLQVVLRVFDILFRLFTHRSSAFLNKSTDMIKSGIQWMKSSKNRTIIDLHADLSLVISMVADELPDDPAAAKLFCIGRMFLYPVFCTKIQFQFFDALRDLPCPRFRWDSDLDSRLFKFADRAFSQKNLSIDSVFLDVFGCESSPGVPLQELPSVTLGIPDAFAEVDSIEVDIRLRLFALFNLQLKSLTYNRLQSCFFCFSEPEFVPDSFCGLFSLLKKYIFFKEKIHAMNLLMETLPTDSYHSVRLDRINASQGTGELVFSQLCSQMRNHSAYFRSRHQAWEVRFVNEGATDCGGPFRDSLSSIARELMSEQLKIFIPSPNVVAHVSGTSSGWILNPSFSTGADLRFVGYLFAQTFPQKIPLDIELCPPMWKILVGEPLVRADLFSFDLANAELLNRLAVASSDEIDSLGLTFTASLADGSIVPLVTNGDTIPVSYDNVSSFLNLLENKLLTQFDHAAEFVVDGIQEILSKNAWSLLTAEQFENVVCGDPDCPTSVLKEISRIHDIPDQNVEWLWMILEEFTPRQRCQFLRFSTGASRLPRHDSSIYLEVYPTGYHDCLPHASTCGWCLELPAYSSFDLMRKMLLIAIENCADIDADFEVDEDSDYGSDYD